jgi:hypothetical protein
MDYARPREGIDAPRLLDDAAYSTAFEAWRCALDSVVDHWNAAADPANLTPPVPAAMQRAVQLVREHKPASMTNEDADRLVDALEAPYPERVVRTIRAALRADGTPSEKVEILARTAAELGLEPSPPPEPLPEITEEDVHLVCWLALVPADGPETGT